MSTRVLYLGATEYIEATITADVTLDTETVAMSIDGGATWLAASWLGSSGTTRGARTNSPVVVSSIFPIAGVYPLLAKVGDGTETTIVSCGGVAVR